VNIRAPKIITVNPTGFGHTLREAVSDSIELASGMFVFVVRTLIVSMPVLIFVVLPCVLLLRYLVRRAKRERLAAALATPAAD